VRVARNKPDRKGLLASAEPYILRKEVQAPTKMRQARAALFAFRSYRHNHSVYALRQYCGDRQSACLDCLPEQCESAGRSAISSSTQRTPLSSGRCCSPSIGWSPEMQGTSRRCGPGTGCRTRNGDRFHRGGIVCGMRSTDVRTVTARRPVTSGRLRSFQGAS